MQLKEITVDGAEGPEFFVCFDGVFCKEWQNNPTLKAAIGQKGNVLVLLQSKSFFLMSI